MFTPRHITDFIYRILEVNQDDRVLDATCGSGGFLVKAMANMIEAGGVNTEKAREIKQNQLFGIEFDREIYARMREHAHPQGRQDQPGTAGRQIRKRPGKWIGHKNITKVLMNPPLYEKKYGCMDIVENVWTAFHTHTSCAFILPD